MHSLVGQFIKGMATFPYISLLVSFLRGSADQITTYFVNTTKIFRRGSIQYILILALTIVVLFFFFFGGAGSSEDSHFLYSFSFLRNHKIRLWILQYSRPLVKRVHDFNKWVFI